MLGAGTFINPLLKLVTTVVILGAVYLFIVKPALDTTNNAFDSFNSAFPNAGDLSSDIQSQIDDALNGSTDTSRLRACLKHALANGANQQRIDDCVARFGS